MQWLHLRDPSERVDDKGNEDAPLFAPVECLAGIAGIPADPVAEGRQVTAHKGRILLARRVKTTRFGLGFLRPCPRHHAQGDYPYKPLFHSACFSR